PRARSPLLPARVLRTPPRFPPPEGRGRLIPLDRYPLASAHSRNGISSRSTARGGRARVGWKALPQNGPPVDLLCNGSPMGIRCGAVIPAGEVTGPGRMVGGVTRLGQMLGGNTRPGEGREAGTGAAS